MTVQINSIEMRAGDRQEFIDDRGSFRIVFPLWRRLALLVFPRYFAPIVRR